jgi:hypothetical protein
MNVQSNDAAPAVSQHDSAKASASLSSACIVAALRRHTSAISPKNSVGRGYRPLALRPLRDGYNGDSVATGCSHRRDRSDCFAGDAEAARFMANAWPLPAVLSPKTIVTLGSCGSSGRVGLGTIQSARGWGDQIERLQRAGKNPAFTGPVS